MRMVQQWMPAVLALALGACAAEQTNENQANFETDSQSAALSTEVKAVSEYYTVRHDYRRCASPMCGGYFVAAVNQARTKCSDGRRETECYVAEIDLPEGIDLADGDLVHGKLALRKYATGNLFALAGDFAFSPVLDTATKGYHFLAFDTGIRCIKSPCPSLGLTALNTDSSFRFPQFTFAAKDAATLEEAFYNELGDAAAAGTGALSVGNLSFRFDRRTRSFAPVLDVQNVYVTKTSVAPTCLVLTEEGRVTAWNLDSRAQAEEFAAALSGEVQILDSACADAALFCTFIYRPVHGTIDALGEECASESNACAFRSAVIKAAGSEGKAQGNFSDGACEEVVSCEEDSDCESGFCGWNEANDRVCKPWSHVGEQCEGYVPPSYRRRCAPELVCEYTEPTGDAGGTCQKP